MNETKTRPALRLLQCHRQRTTQPMRFFDSVTGDLIEVSVSPLCAKVSLNGRVVYVFDRFEQAFDTAPHEL